MPIGEEDTIPFVLGEEEPTITASGERLYKRTLPLWSQDQEQEWFGRYFCQAAMAMLQELDVIVTDTPTHPGWCILADPLEAPAQWLPWTAQLFGVVPPPDADTEEERAIIEELPPQKRGGVEAMKAAAKLTLSGTKTVDIIEQVDGFAYRMLATTLPAETPDEAMTLNALLSQKPGGVKLIYICTAYWLVAEVEEAYAGKDVHEFEAAFATVHAVETHGVI